MQNTRFNFTLRILDLGDYDMILGVDWMQKHGPITFDFADHRLLICKEGKQVELKGMKEEMALKMISLKSVNRLIFKGWKAVTSRLFVMISKVEENPKPT